MQIRTLSEGDATACWNLRLEALRTEPLAFGEAVEEHQATSVETMAARIRNMSKGSFILGAFEEEALVGMVRFVREEYRKERHKGNIYGFYVRQSERGRKTGRALLVELLRIANEDSSLEQISLAVATSQLSAIHLYRSFGFEVFGTEPRALKVDGQYVDEHHMVLRLRP